MAYELGNSIKVSAGETIIGGQQECSLTMESELSDTTTKDSGDWSEEEVVGLSWSIECSGLIAVDDKGVEALETAWKAKQTVDIKYGTPQKFKKGKALIESLERNSASKEKSTYSVSFKGVGELTDGTEPSL